VNTKKVQGFSLIELLLVLVIMGILAAIALPNYTSYMQKTRRAAAEAALESFANAMERHFTINNSYLGAGSAVSSGGDANSAGAPTIYPAQIPSDTPYYNLTIQPDVTSSFYRLRATPIATAPQAGNGYLELTSTGERRWDKDDAGTIVDWNGN
jgi:type IV pilus assembly protein PilE